MSFADNNTYPEDWAEQEPPDDDAPPELIPTRSIRRYTIPTRSIKPRNTGPERECNGDCGVCQTLHPPTMRGNAFHITTKEP